MAFAAGSRSCMEAVKGDLRGIQAALKELLVRTEGTGIQQMPSWRFPDKTAAALPAEELARDLTSSGVEREADCESHVLLLELVMDRLLLLLQCSLHLSSEPQSAPLPLTLGSAARKFSRRFVKDVVTAEDMKLQIKAKTAQISSMEASIAKLQETCQFLQQSLHNSIPTVTLDGDHSNLSLQPSRPTTGTSTTRHERETYPLPSSSAIPYQAQLSLKTNRLNNSAVWGIHSAQSGKLCKSEIEADQHQSDSQLRLDGQVSALAKSIGGAAPPSHDVINDLHLPSPRPLTESVCTQTTDTAFALCARCTDTQSTLVCVASDVGNLCLHHSHISAMVATDWSAQAEVGGLQLEQWAVAMKRDLSLVDASWHAVEHNRDRLVAQLSDNMEAIASLERENEVLNKLVESLREVVSEVRETGATALAQREREFAAEVGRLVEDGEGERGRNTALKVELGVARGMEERLKRTVAELEQRHGGLQERLQSLLREQGLLEEAKRQLEGEVEGLRSSLRVSLGQLEGKTVDVKKNRAHALSLERKNKSLQAKHAGLLSRLDELDMDCTRFRDALGTSESKGAELSGEVERMQGECTELRGRLAAETERLTASLSEQEALSSLVAKLRQEMGVARREVEEERANARLLMDYPFVKQTAEGYHRHVESMLASGGESHRQISANTVRILLLEEQNGELREGIVSSAMQGRRDGKHFQLKHPTKLWQKSLLLTAEEELGPGHTYSKINKPQTAEMIRKKQSFVAKLPSKKAPHRSRTSRSSSTGREQTRPLTPSDDRPLTGVKFHGRLGHLASAIAVAPQLAVDESNTALSSNHASTSSLEDLHTLDQRDVRSKDASNPGGHIEVKDLESLDGSFGDGSFGDMEFYMCSGCDRMFNDRDELEHHQTTCTSW